MTTVYLVAQIFFKIGGLLSSLGSILIQRDVIKQRRKKKKAPVTSTILSQLSLGDMFTSFFVSFLGTWMVPRETGARWAAGNTATCTTQGFMGTLFLCVSILSNAHLAIAYLLIAKRGWKDEYKKEMKMRLLVWIPPTFGLIWAVGLLFDQAYNYNGSNHCTLAPYPTGCTVPDSEVECTRGANAPQIAFIVVLLIMSANFCIFISVALLVHTVYTQERKMDRYSADGSSNRTHTIKSSWQGIWYCMAFAIVWIPTYISNMLGFSPGTEEQPPVLLIIASLTYPTQGVWNALVYFRPRYKQDRERHSSETRISSIGRILDLDLSPLQKLTVRLSVGAKARDSSNTALSDECNSSQVEQQAQNFDNNPSDPPHLTDKQIVNGSNQRVKICENEGKGELVRQEIETKEHFPV